MQQDDLFLRTLEDLAKKVASGKQYDWLRSSGILRQLLLDGGSLVIEANRSHRLRLKFEVPDATGQVIPGTIVWIAGDDGCGQPTKEVDRDGFLSAGVIYMNGTWRTVRDVIDVCANSLGGIHKGKPRDDGQEELSKLNDQLQCLGGGAVEFQVRRIGRITIRAVLPLAEAVASSHREPAKWAATLTALRDAMATTKTESLGVLSSLRIWTGAAQAGSQRYVLPVIAEPVPDGMTVLRPTYSDQQPVFVGQGDVDLFCGTCKNVG
jgi:hypothetical protein